MACYEIERVRERNIKKRFSFGKDQCSLDVAWCCTMLILFFSLLSLMYKLFVCL